MIRQRAAAAGEPLARYLRAIADVNRPLDSIAALPKRKPPSEAEMRKWLDQMAIDLPNVAPSGLTYSREDIYLDHG